VAGGSGALQAATLLSDCARTSSLYSRSNYWIARIRCPFTRIHHLAGYWWQLSMRQVETSRTIVLDTPRGPRALFQALVADIGIGRPAVVTMLFGSR
jgi:hypothetical protein